MYDATKTTLQPEPESIIDMTVCGCKAGCNTNWCKCLTNGRLKCTEMWKCYNCENVEPEDYVSLYDHVIIEENTEFESWTIILLSWQFILCDNKSLK